MKILKTLSLICSISSFLLASNEIYFIKATGEFGKNLSELAKRYAKDNQNSVEIFIDEDPRVYKDTRIIKAGVNKKGRYSQSLGKELYESKCSSCHGNAMQKRPSGTTPLKNMSAVDIEDSIIAYRNDPEFGKSTKAIMQGISKTITNAELGAIIFYIKGKDAYVNENIEQENKPVSTQKSQGSYLR